MKRHLSEALLWFLFILATGFWFGLWQHLGQHTGRALVRLLIEAVHR